MNKADIQPLPLLPSQIEQAGNILARAFHNDPLLLYISPKEKPRAKLLPPLQKSMIRYGLLYGKVYTTVGMEGVAIWHAPGKTEMSFWRLLRSGMLAVPFKMPLKAFLRLMKVEKPSEHVRKQALSGHYWYLAVLGVDPEHQGKGVGGALVKPVLKKADANGLACFLETMNPDNLSFYNKLGFEVSGETRVSQNQGEIADVHIWGMVRLPSEKSTIRKPNRGKYD